MNKNLFIMCGLSCSGKSTFTKKIFKSRADSIVISRDEIRESLLQPGDSYWIREAQVYTILWKTINESLAKDKIENVVVDMCSLTPKSRNYLLDNINLDYFTDNVYVIYMNTKLETCLSRNHQRNPYKKYPVRDSDIINMSRNLQIPDLSIETRINKLIIINEEEDSINDMDDFRFSL